MTRIMPLWTDEISRILNIANQCDDLEVYSIVPPFKLMVIYLRIARHLFISWCPDKYCRFTSCIDSERLESQHVVWDHKLLLFTEPTTDSS